MALLRRLACACAALALVALSEEPVADGAAPVEAAPAEGGAESDKTGDLLKELTIVMGNEVIDERTFVIRDTAKSGKKYIRLGNVAPIEKGSMSDEEYQEKKEAPEQGQLKEQTDEETATVIADIWTIDGRHINGVLTKAGHLAKTEDYESELAKDILTAAADTNKRDMYKDLEEALKESHKAKAQAAAEEAEQEPAEPLGLSGWIGLSVVGLLVAGVALDFGRAPKKQKVNLNRKRGIFGQLMSKLKGQ